MSKLNIMLKQLFTLVLLIFSTFTYAGTAEIYWDDPKEYTDIDGGVANQALFAKRVQLAFNSHFKELAKRLPANQLWKIRISDLDLAGNVSKVYFRLHYRPTSRGELRVMDAFFNPSITISYIITDTKSGKIIAGDKLFKLTDYYVTRYPSSQFMVKDFSYEKYMIKAWFNKVLLPFANDGS